MAEDNLLLMISYSYAKDVKEWIWQYANHRGYLTSYGVDNNSGMMGTRTNCKVSLGICDYFIIR